MKKLFLLLLFAPACCVVFAGGCTGQGENVVIEPNPDLDEAAETLRSETELETTQ